MSHENNATAAFAARVQRIREMAAKIVAQCDDHYGLSPEDVQWGNVGDAGRIETGLRELIGA